ncbi:MAG: Uma2 family endonuclease, partial [Nostoc sp.]
VGAAGRGSTILSVLVFAIALNYTLARVTKEGYYRSIPEFKEYILIDQYQYHVMQYVKTAESQWSFTELEHESATLSLQTVDFKIELRDLYEQVNFTENNED